MATILGITGAIGSGKSTFSDFLAAAQPHSTIYESRQVISEVAEQFNKALLSEINFEVANDDVEVINQALIWLTSIINEQLHTEVSWAQPALTQHRLAKHPKYYEKLFAYLKLLRVNPKLGGQPITKENKADYRPLLQWLGGYLVGTVSKTIWFDEIFRRIDLYDNDKQLIIINGLRYPTDAEVVRIHGGQIIEIQRPRLTSDVNDITEAQRSEIKPDCQVINNGSLKELAQLAARVWEDAAVSKLAKRYSSA